MKRLALFFSLLVLLPDLPPGLHRPRPPERPGDRMLAAYFAAETPSSATRACRDPFDR